MTKSSGCDCLIDARFFDTMFSTIFCFSCSWVRTVIVLICDDVRDFGAFPNELIA